MFGLLNQTAQVSNINVRGENHGDDIVPAIDVSCDAVVENTILNELHPELRGLLFRKSDEPDLAEQGQQDALTCPRFPQLGTIKWDYQSEGYSVVFRYGVDSSLSMVGCKLKIIKITPQPSGGFVLLSFQVQSSSVNTKDIGDLCALIKHEVEIDLTYPQQDLPQSDIED